MRVKDIDRASTNPLLRGQQQFKLTVYQVRGGVESDQDTRTTDLSHKDDTICRVLEDNRVEGVVVKEKDRRRSKRKYKHSVASAHREKSERTGKEN